MPESNAVEYERKRDAITDLKENYLAIRRLHRILLVCTTICALLVVGSVLYGMFVDGQAGLPPALFGIGLAIGVPAGVYYGHVRGEKEMPAKKKVRDAEREFKYWSIDNPPC